MNEIAEILKRIEAHVKKPNDWKKSQEREASWKTSKTRLTAPTDQCMYGECDGSGFILFNMNGDVFGEKCKCYGQKIIESKIKFADIPEEFKDLTIGAFKTDIYQTEESRKRAILAKQAAVNFVKNFEEIRAKGKGLYFYGYEKGSGKTRLVVSIGNALMSVHKVGVKFVTTINLIGEIKATFDKGAAYTQSQLLEAVKRVDVLILDDIGTEKLSAWVNEVFYSVVNDRMTGNKVTIFTSNGRIDELQHDERIKNRIEKMALPVWFPEESVRRYLAKGENEWVQERLFQ